MHNVVVRVLHVCGLELSPTLQKPCPKAIEVNIDVSGPYDQASKMSVTLKIKENDI